MSAITSEAGKDQESLTFVQLAQEVLRASAQPMTTREIWAQAKVLGLDARLRGAGKTPEASLGTALYGEANRLQGRFVKTDERPARFTLPEQGDLPSSSSKSPSTGVPTALSGLPAGIQPSAAMPERPGRPMFSRLRLRNFKAWGEQLWDPGLELAPITLLLGKNSAGKTSIVQAPLLLQQTFLSPDRHLDLNLGGQLGDRLSLGGYSDVVHGHEVKHDLGIGLTWDPGEGPSIEYTAEFIHRSDQAETKRLALRTGQEEYAVERTSKGGYRLIAPGYQQAKAYGNREFRPERSVAFSADAIGELAKMPDSSHGASVQDLSLRFRRATTQVAYLGPLRDPPQRTYLWANQNPSTLGDTGRNAVTALLASRYTRGREDLHGEFGPDWLVTRTSFWLERLGLSTKLSLEQQGRSRHYEVQMHGQHGEQANLVDVGFGLSQVLPMIVLAHFVPRGTTIIAEQPEIHLHPSAQAGLADMIVAVAKERQVQFIIETHSEHLFRRLQFLVSDTQVAAEDCRLYFVGRNQQGTPGIERLQMDDYGMVKNWPKHFFGDSLGETERQMERMFKRKIEEQHGK